MIILANALERKIKTNISRERENPIILIFMFVWNLGSFRFSSSPFLNIERKSLIAVLSITQRLALPKLPQTYLASVQQPLHDLQSRGPNYF